MHRASKAPFTFIVSIMVPSNPPFHLIMSWAADAPHAEMATLGRHAALLHAGSCQTLHAPQRRRAVRARLCARLHAAWWLGSAQVARCSHQRTSCKC